MDSLYATPLVDCFRRGDVSHDIRMLAARGILAPRAHEQLQLLVLLSRDADPLVRSAAEETLRKIPEPVLSKFLGRPEVADAVREFFAGRGIQPIEADAAVDEPVIVTNDGEPEPEEEPPPADPSAPEAEQRRMATVQRLALMTVTQKVKAAMRGSREERGVLIRDPNKLVPLAVLSSPKLTEQEVEGFARMASVSEEALRVIGTSRAWVKNYRIVQALVFNPKTPIALSLGFVKLLLERDVRNLATDRNVPDPLKIAARKIVQAGQSRRH